MTSEIQQMQKQLKTIQKDIGLIKHILEEDYELSDYAKKQLEEADKTPISEYIDHEEVKKRLLR